MDAGIIVVLWILFGGTHIGMSSLHLRQSLIDKWGNTGFLLVYSLISLLTFGLLVIYYDYARTGLVSAMPLPLLGAALAALAYLLLLLALVLLCCSLFNRTPMGMVPVKAEAYGITRITRHPLNMGFLLFGLAHMLVACSSLEWAFFGGFVVFSYLSAVHQDKKKASLAEGELDEFIQATSVFPFAAILSGKQPFVISEISKLGVILGLVAAIYLYGLHGTLAA